jgi:hypothetical protein
VGGSKDKRSWMICTPQQIFGWSNQAEREANNSWHSQNIPHTSRNLKVHYHVHNYPPLFPIMSQISPVHTLPSHFFRVWKINVNNFYSFWIAALDGPTTLLRTYTCSHATLQSFKVAHPCCIIKYKWILQSVNTMVYSETIKATCFG